MDKKKEKMTPERRYELACLILGGVVLGGALGLGVASVLAAVVHLRRTPAAETRAYREGPLALALVLCVGVAALCVCFFLYLTI